jgi:uncharacterized membrane-anchored protein
MTKAELINELVGLGFQAETLEGKTNAQLQAMLAEANTDESTDPVEPVEEAEEPTEEVVETEDEPTDPVNHNSPAIMVRNVIHDNKEYKLGQELSPNDPVRLFVRQGYAK